MFKLGGRFRRALQRRLAYQPADPLAAPPWMSPNIWALIDESLCGTQMPRVLEYGTGCSSVWHVRRMVQGRGGTYVGVEHDHEWCVGVLAALVREAAKERWLRSLEVVSAGETGMDFCLNLVNREQIGTVVHLRSRPPKGNPTGDGNSHQFGSYIHAIDDAQYDLVVVDGRARNCCVNHALDTHRLGPGGTLVLCDAGRGVEKWLGQPTCVGDADYQPTVRRMLSLGACLRDGVGLGNWSNVATDAIYGRSTRPYPLEACFLKIPAERVAT